MTTSESSRCSCDVLVVGAGIIGLTVARELLNREIQNIVVLEKEPRLGAHASGRNSGVLHAGIYYASDSLKARFCSRGAKLLKAYAQTRGVQVLPIGKVIVASKEEDLLELNVLLQRSAENQIRVERINEARLSQIEPAARTMRWALYSPDTAVFDPAVVLEALRSDLIASGVKIRMSEGVLSIDSQKNILSTAGTIWHYGHLINAAGLQADRLAHGMGIGLQYRSLPFRGRYQKLTKKASDQIHGLIYPVPDPALPFLGVHLTKSTKGDVWVGPTAEPALGREHYRGVQGIDWKELPRILADLFAMTLHNSSGLARHILGEGKKRLPGGLLAAAQRLMPTLCLDDITDELKIGVRAQLVDIRKNQLVMDFVVEKGPDSTHILNAISPGFTASFAFAEYIVDLALDKSTNQVY